MRQRKGSSERDAEGSKDKTLCENPEGRNSRFPAPFVITCCTGQATLPLPLASSSSTVNGLKSTVHFVHGGPGTSLPNPGLPLPHHPHPYSLPPCSPTIYYSTWPIEQKSCSLPQFPSNFSLRLSSLFPGQVAGVQFWKESCANSGRSPGRALAGCQGAI